MVVIRLTSSLRVVALLSGPSGDDPCVLGELETNSSINFDSSSFEYFFSGPTRLPINTCGHASGGGTHAQASMTNAEHDTSGETWHLRRGPAQQRNKHVQRRPFSHMNMLQVFRRLFGLLRRTFERTGTAMLRALEPDVDDHLNDDTKPSSPTSRNLMSAEK